ncbi:serine/threonine-protein kinase, partial [Actinoallomurus acaciae]
MDGTPVPVGSAVLPADVLPLAPGDPATVGGHTLVGRLGTGGMGVVYLGRDEDGRLAAVKVAHTGTVGEEEARARFRDEVASLIRVPSHCTARPLADGTEHTPPYIVTEYVAGRSLKEIVERDGALPPEPLRVLATGVLRALTAIHRAGLVHGDLKPANVLMARNGPRVIDFGIAQSVSAAGGPAETGRVVGSVGWIAPERLSLRPAAPASDVFCWGCLIAYAGTGRNPFGEGDAVEMAGRALFEQPDLRGLDPSVRSLVTSALAKDPGDRPTADQLLARLDPADPLAADDRSDDTVTNLAPITRTRRRPRMLAAACADARM